MRTLIKGGTIVNADATTRADVLVDGETIALIGTDLEATAGRVIDAAGKWVIPGGMTCTPTWSCPSAAPSPGHLRDRDAGCRLRGTTTIIDFAVQPRGGSLRDGLDAWREKAEGKACIDYGFHVIISDVRDDVLAEMDTLVEEGVTTFKLFTAYRRLLQRRRRNLPGDAADPQERRADHDARREWPGHRRSGRPELRGRQHRSLLPRHQPLAGARGEATNRVIRLAQVAEAPVYIVHLAAREALNEVRRARDEGLPAFARPARNICSSRWRTWATASRAASSSARRRCGRRPPGGPGSACSRTTCRSSPPMPVRLPRAEGDGARRLPQGAERPARRRERMDLLHSGGVAEGRLTPNRWVEITSTAPARMFGLPQKGAVQVGLDADLVVYDPKSQAHHQRQHPPHGRRLQLLRGWQVSGGADVVLSRGRIVVDGDEWLGEAGSGRFLKAGAQRLPQIGACGRRFVSGERLRYPAVPAVPARPVPLGLPATVNSCAPRGGDPASCLRDRCLRQRRIGQSHAFGHRGAFGSPRGAPEPSLPSESRGPGSADPGHDRRRDAAEALDARQRVRELRQRQRGGGRNSCASLGVSPDDVSVAIGFGISPDSGSGAAVFVFRAEEPTRAPAADLQGRYRCRARQRSTGSRSPSAGSRWSAPPTRSRTTASTCTSPATCWSSWPPPARTTPPRCWQAFLAGGAAASRGRRGGWGVEWR